MARVNFTGLAGNISDLNANFTQLYALRELISDASYTAATPKLSVNAAGNWIIPAPSTGLALSITGVTGTKILQLNGPAANTASMAIYAVLGQLALLRLGGNGLDAAGFDVQQDSAGAADLVNRSNARLSLYTNALERLQITAAGDVLQVSGSLGYGTGSGGAVTQLTSKSTGVTLNKSNGAITLNAASLAANTSVAFTLTNSLIAATDVVHVTIKSGATANSYFVSVDATNAGSCSISLRNYTGGALAEAVVLNFALIKAVTA